LLEKSLCHPFPYLEDLQIEDPQIEKSATKVSLHLEAFVASWEA
jgi:hypothetical protein